jgi:hypothetical protein
MDGSSACLCEWGHIVLLELVESIFLVSSHNHVLCIFTFWDHPFFCRLCLIQSIA